MPQWPQAAQMKQQVFVANRVAEILEHLSMDQWRHVKGVENPADIGTQGESNERFQMPAWLDEPAWLKGMKTGAKAVLSRERTRNRGSYQYCFD